MIKCLLIKMHDYVAIVGLLFKHLKKKWRLETSGFISVIIMMILGLLLPAITSALYGYQLDFFSVAATYSSMTVCGILIMIMASSNLTVSRMIYESKYFCRLFRFMITCYNNIVEQYKAFVRMHIMFKRREFKFQFSHDMTIVSTIFIKIFQMYFDSIDNKLKNPEPYLIDTQEMKSLYSSKEFNDFYSMLFFNPSCEKSKTPYEQVLIQILDEVMTALYEKPWFVDYYDEQTVFQMVKYILSNWYGNIVKYGTYQPVIREDIL